ncbi:DNA-deoxyinosine glycosylase [Sphingomonas sp. HDW15A]|uniref:DNA-deoxyinosine glycosylase n=1 Tax=Sphingomonas sp. HDW15A TaxID=2714942 RepID=UPI0014078A86|nr:DNA-deoxyinosine glycosylase [Sphingomonas sp. HDW15A]QIK95353.1 DNA-deoxyinosine glycosylase [Sphingomonas sp. HDW15A]
MKVGFPAIADERTRLFILGSLPGDRSIVLRQYYGHPTNHFWRLLGAVLGEPLPDLPYGERLKRLTARGIGLWDVFHAAHREGSGDTAIREGRHNALHDLVGLYPDLRAIAFNGGTAAREGRRYFTEGGPAALIGLPSSSAANTIGFEAKLAAWKQLTSFLTDP